VRNSGTDMFGYLSESSLLTLQAHVFEPGQSTPLDKLLNPFWEALARLLPASISPNVISLLGGAFATVAAITCACAAHYESRSLHIAASLGILLYQTFDAVDGKHARNTQQTTPLGAVIDHGVDALVCLMCVVSLYSLWESFVEPSTITFAVGAALYNMAWFCSQWAEFETHVTDVRGITEAECLMAFLMSLPGFLGLEIYNTLISVPLLGVMQFRAFAELLVCVLSAVGVLAHVFRVMLVTRRPGAFAPPSYMILHGVASVAFNATSLGRQSPLITLLVVNMNAVTFMTKMRLSASTSTPWPVVHLDTFPFFLLVACELAGCQLGGGALVSVLAWQSLTFILMWHNTVSRICASLDIPFLLPVQQKQG